MVATLAAARHRLRDSPGAATAARCLTSAYALRDAISEFQRVCSIHGGEVDPRFVRMIEQSAGLKGLKFETDPVSGAREMQPVIDAHGRITGFFTLDADHPMIRTMDRLMPALVG